MRNDRRRSTSRGRALLAVALALVALGSPLAAQVTLAALFSDHAVVQQGRSIPVWGAAPPATRLTVSFAGERITTLAGAEGRWRVTFDAQSAGGPHEILVRSKGGEIRVRDVHVGEVWVCSGQSNMQWSVRRSANPDEEIANADHPRIRLFSVPRRASAEPRRDVEAAWAVCSPKTVGSFSAVAYYFGRELAKTGPVIGLVHTSWGGTPAEAWTREPALVAAPVCKPIVDRFRKRLPKLPALRAEFQKRLTAWKSTRRGRRPRPPIGPNHHHAPANLFNGMIHPLLPYAIRGVIWYQGESNARRAFQYRTLFSTMIRDWREAWGQGDFPFLFVQLANFRRRKAEPAESDWAELREAQALALRLPNTGMATAIDIGEARDIHPKDKQSVGRRLALAARRIAYEEDVEWRGPTFRRMRRDGSKLLVSFDAANGMELRGATDRSFQVAGRDRAWHWARVTRHPALGDVLVVSSPDVADPIALRYAWADNPAVCVYNAAGLPAPPFRTDDWPGVTTNAR